MDLCHSVNYVLPTHAGVSIETEGKHWETCSLDLDWINEQAILFITLTILIMGIAGVHSKSV